MHDSTSRGHGASRWLVLTLAGLLAMTWMDLKRCHARRRSERTQPTKPEPLQTWEGEGGGIPAVRGQRTSEAPAGAGPLLTTPLAD